jgi:hypothetical protein
LSVALCLSDCCKRASDAPSLELENEPRLVAEIVPERPGPSLKELKTFREKFEADTSQAAQRWTEGLPVIWCEPNRTNAKQRAGARNETKDGEREIDKILLRDSRPVPAGRKSDPTYDKAVYRRKIGEIVGKPVSVGTLAKDILAGDHSPKVYKLNKMKQAFETS